MHAIHVKFLNPTNLKGCRYKASCQEGSLSVRIDPALGAQQNALRAARALAVRFGWKGEVVIGELPDSSFACVFIAGDKATL